MQTTEVVDIAVLSCNRARITQLCLEEIAKRTTTPHRVVVVDNGSTDGSDAVLEAMLADGIINQLVLNEENWGVHWGFNRLLELVRSPIYVCTDSDLIPCSPVNGEDWLQHLLELKERNPKYASIACRPHILIGEHGDCFKDSPEVRRMSHTGAHLRLMEAETVRQVGGWKKVKKPSRNNEDWHICGLLRKAGYEVGYARDVRCIHLFGEAKYGEDDWGYPVAEGEDPHDGRSHGHRPVWPYVPVFSWHRVGVNWETCE